MPVLLSSDTARPQASVTHTHIHTDTLKPQLLTWCFQFKKQTKIHKNRLKPTVQFDHLLPLSAAPLEPEDSSKQGVSMSATPVYSELWFILLLALLGLFLLAILLGLVLQRYLNTTCRMVTEQNKTQPKNKSLWRIFVSTLQSPEEESISQRAPSAGHASEDQEGWWGDVHGERSREIRSSDTKDA